MFRKTEWFSDIGHHIFDRGRKIKRVAGESKHVGDRGSDSLRNGHGIFLGSKTTTQRLFLQSISKC
jgi:hypothetical protein